MTMTGMMSHIDFAFWLTTTTTYPPAHAKPTIESFASTSPASSKKSPFAEFFRLGSKSKSKPSTPTGRPGSSGSGGPLVRTASDQSTAGYAHHPMQGTSPSLPSPGTQDPRSGRVVVVREKMPDLAAAAKIAELEMKSRHRVEERDEAFDTSVIDPTDTVDLPPPSMSSLFALQASALRGLDAEHSVGAALLAERLPPGSPGLLSNNTDDEWRRALLEATVGHSFDTSRSSGPSLSSPMLSMTPNSLNRSRDQSKERSPLLGEKIVTVPPLDNRLRPKMSARGLSRIKTDSIPEEPVRVQTPDAPLSPLSPPPRRQIINPLYSLSQTELADDGTVKSPADPTFVASNNPRLTDSYEANVRTMPSLTPPPQGRPFTGRPSTDVPVLALDHSSVNKSPTSPSHSDLELYKTGSEALASKESLENSRRDTISTYGRQSTSSGEQTQGTASGTISPPPRRSSVGAMRNLYPSFQGGFGSVARNDPDSGLPLASVEHIQAPEPTTPPLPISNRPLSERRGNPSGAPLSLHVPTGNFPPQIHSAPPPASPTSFFDSIASQPNALDDLDSSSDEDEDEEHYNTASGVLGRSSTSTFHDNSADSRSTFMRLGNYSSPHVSHPRSSQDPIPLVPSRTRTVDSRFAVENSPQRTVFPKKSWTRRLRSDSGHGSASPSAIGFMQYSRHASEDPGGSDRERLVDTRPASVEGRNVRTQAVQSTPLRQREDFQQRTHASVLQLDDMMKRHMEAEKGRMRDIAAGMKNGSER